MTEQGRKSVKILLRMRKKLKKYNEEVMEQAVKVKKRNKPSIKLLVGHHMDELNLLDGVIRELMED